MQIKIICTTDREDLESQEMFINDKRAMEVRPLCFNPEDAIIGRDLVSCDDVAFWMKKAYEAGKSGETFAVEIVEE